MKRMPLKFFYDEDPAKSFYEPILIFFEGTWCPISAVNKHEMCIHTRTEEVWFDFDDPETATLSTSNGVELLRWIERVSNS